MEIQQLLNITFSPDPCLDGPFNGNGTWTIEYRGPRPVEYDDESDRPSGITVSSRKVEGEAHSYHYTNANKQPYIIDFEVTQLISESFTPDEEKPYGHHGDHGRVKRQGRGRGPRGTQTGRMVVMARGRPKGGLQIGASS